MGRRVGVVYNNLHGAPPEVSINISLSDEDDIIEFYVPMIRHSRFQLCNMRGQLIGTRRYTCQILLIRSRLATCGHRI